VSRQIKGVLLNRILVLVMIILIPVAIFLIFLFVDFELWYSTDPILTFWIIKVACPIVFGVSWLFFMILFADRLALTIDSMDRVVSIIPLRLKLFYGMIAIVVLFIFVFPLISPLIGVISFMSLAWRATTYKKKEWSDSGSPFYTKILMVLVAVLPIFCTVSIIPEYLVLSAFLTTQIWQPITDFIYTISYCLCTALAIGSLFYLVENKGISEYEVILVDTTQKKSFWYVKFVELGLFVFFLFLDYGGFEIIELFYTAGFVIVVFVSIVNHFSEKQKTGKVRGHILGYLLAAIFLGSNSLVFYIDLPDFINIISLIVLAGVFIVVFLLTFIYLEETKF